jgi:hypothetical protein
MPSWEDIVNRVVIASNHYNVAGAGQDYQNVLNQLHQLKGALDTLNQQTESWTGAAADAFREQLTSLSGSVEGLATDHSRIPSGLQACSEHLEKAISQIEIPSWMYDDVQEKQRVYAETGEVLPYSSGSFWNSYISTVGDALEWIPGIGSAWKAFEGWFGGREEKAKRAYDQLAHDYSGEYPNVPEGRPADGVHYGSTYNVNPSGAGPGTSAGSPGLNMGPGGGTSLQSAGPSGGAGGFGGGPGSGAFNPGATGGPGSGSLSGASGMGGAGAGGAGGLGGGRLPPIGAAAHPPGGMGGMMGGMGAMGGAGGAGARGGGVRGGGGLGGGAGGRGGMMGGMGAMGAGAHGAGGRAAGGRAGGAGTGGAGRAGGAGGAAGAGAGRAGMMGAGGAHGAGGEDGDERTTWLEEDEDVWGGPSAPPGVLGG